MFKYFNVNSTTTEADLKKQLRKLAMKNHPDRGGTTKAMSSINNEYDRALKHIKNPFSQSRSQSNNYSNTHSRSNTRSRQSNPFEDFRDINDINDFFESGVFEDYMNSRFKRDECQYFKEKRERQRRAWEEERRRHQENLNRRVYYFHGKIKFWKFSSKKREKIISRINSLVKKSLGCKMFVKKREPARWYQLYETIEFKVKCKGNYNFNLKSVLRKLKSLYWIYELREDFEQK